ncbi:hypothetical protein D3C75_659180 [compost metagenome]
MLHLPRMLGRALQLPLQNMLVQKQHAAALADAVVDQHIEHGEAFVRLGQRHRAVVQGKGDQRPHRLPAGRLDQLHIAHDEHPQRLPAAVITRRLFPARLDQPDQIGAVHHHMGALRMGGQILLGNQPDAEQQMGFLRIGKPARKAVQPPQHHQHRQVGIQGDAQLPELPPVNVLPLMLPLHQPVQVVPLQKLLRRAQTGLRLLQQGLRLQFGVQIRQSLLYNLDNPVIPLRFQEIPHTFVLNGRVYIRKFIMPRQKNHPALRPNPADFLQQLQAVHLRHPDIAQHNIGAHPLAELHRFMAGIGLVQVQLQMLQIFEHLKQPVCNNRLIIHD